MCRGSRRQTARTASGSGRRQSAHYAAAPQRRLRVFAVTQIAASFVLLAGASMLMKTLISLQAAQTGFDTRRVLTVNVPVMSLWQDAGTDPAVSISETMRRITRTAGRG